MLDYYYDREIKTNAIARVLCRHNEIELVRAHPESPTGKMFGHLSAWTDRLGVLNLFRCVRCGKYIKCRITEHVFGMRRTDEGNYDQNHTSS